MAPARLAHQAHTQRAARHYDVGCALRDAANDEWAAVCWFYAGYHHVKAALLQDPIFDDVGRLHVKHHDLQASDRYTDRHQIRKGPGSGPRGWGINELVQLLYPTVIRPYDQLHQASVSVRYRDGLPGDALPGLASAIDDIRDAARTGVLSAS